MDAFLPIILGSDENAYGTVRLFREAYGVRPLLLCTRRLVPTMDSDLFDLTQIDGFDSPAVFPGALSDAVETCRARAEKVVVVSCSDYYTGLLSDYVAADPGQIANPVVSPTLLARLDTKDRFYALCAEYGLPYPKTVIAEADERESVIDSLPFSFPIVVKPENSNASDYLHCHFEGQEKVFYFENREDYLRIIGNMDRSGYRGKLILQEFIPGGDEAMRTLNFYSDADGKVRAMCLGQPILEEYAPKTLGNYAAILSRADRALCERIRSFLEAIGYIGFGNFDMKVDPRTGEAVLFEINPRLGRSSFFVRAAGMNFMKIMTEDVVSGRREDCVFCEETALWTAVPKAILLRYVKDKALVSEVKEMYRKKKVTRTLFNPEEKSLKRFLRLERYYLGHFGNYRRYYFDKHGGAMQKH